MYSMNKINVHKWTQFSENEHVGFSTKTRQTKFPLLSQAYLSVWIDRRGEGAATSFADLAFNKDVLYLWKNFRKVFFQLHIIIAARWKKQILKHLNRKWEESYKWNGNTMLSWY